MGFRDMTIYQIYPKSFYDRSGSGVGDLQGILEKVPYIASLGIDMVWFNPFFVSPQRDNGYDISDYYAIDPKMGTMDDFVQLVAALDERGIGVMLDMVLNHTSTEHEWFGKALAGDPEYLDFYYVRDASADGGPPNNWVSKFGGSAWAPFGDSGRYYLHLFDATQADLNWHNPAVRREMARVVEFWRGKGVRGFRFDVINLIGKPADLPSAPPGVDDRTMYTDGATVHDYLRELAERSYGQDGESVTVGEMSSTSIEACIQYSNPDSRELAMVFNFHHLKVDYLDGDKWTLMPFDFAELKRTLMDWAVGMQDGGGWNALFWNNHDQPRALNRFGDVDGYRYESATMLATALHLLRGTPYVYMGEEIGMTDPEYSAIEEYVDVEAINAYDALVSVGMSPADAFSVVRAKARDNARTPMQWTAEANGGFTAGTPWLRPTNHVTINVENEEAEGKILPFYRKLIRLRKQHAIVAEGTVTPYALDHTSVLAYVRELGDEQILVLTNFYGDPTTIAIPEEFVGGEVFVANYDPAPGSPSREVLLRPYEALVLRRGRPLR